MIEIYIGEKSNSVVKTFDGDKTKLDNALEVIGEYIPVPSPCADDEEKKIVDDSDDIEIVRSAKLNSTAKPIDNNKSELKGPVVAIDLEEEN